MGNIIIVGVVFATVIFLVVSIILSIFLCKCTKKWQKKKERQRYMALLEVSDGAQFKSTTLVRHQDLGMYRL